MRYLTLIVSLLLWASTCLAGQGMGPGPGMIACGPKSYGFESGTIAPWVTSASAWSISSYYNHSGSNAALSVVDGGTLTLTTCTGSGSLSFFYYSPSSASGSWSVDGTTIGSFTGTGTWQGASSGLSAGVHTIVFTDITGYLVLDDISTP